MSRNKKIVILSDKQKRIASQTPPFHKIDAGDLAALRNKNKKNA